MTDNGGDGGVVLPEEDEKFIIEKTIDGFTPEEIQYMLKNDQNSPLTLETVKNFLNQDEVARRIELRKSIMEKQAEVSREDLIRELSEQKDYIIEQRQRLEGSNDEISSDQTKNLLKAIRQLGELIEVLESKDNSGGGNVINVNRLEQNFDITSSVEYLPPEDKKSIVEKLEEDPDIEDYVIVRKEDAENEDSEDVEEENEGEAEVVES